MKVLHFGYWAILSILGIALGIHGCRGEQNCILKRIVPLEIEWKLYSAGIENIVFGTNLNPDSIG